MKPTLFALLALTATFAGCGGQESANAPGATAEQSAATSESHGVGVVQSVDTTSGRVTIAHEPIESLGWPAMTMGFAVARPELLTDVRAGERVEFTLRGRDMAAVVTSIRPAK